MIAANVFCMCAAWRVSCSDHFQWKRSVGMPQRSFARGIDLAIRVLVRDHLAAARQADERAVVAPHVFLELAAVAAGEVGQRPPCCRRSACAARCPSRCDSRARNRACRRAAPCRATTASTRGCRRRRPRCAAAGFRAAGSGPMTGEPTVSIRYLPTLPLEFASPCGNRADFELSMMRTRLARARGQHDDARLRAMLLAARPCR